VLSHRGVSQQFKDPGNSARGCEAARMSVRSHDYIENTIPSIRAAFNQGANVVEFDVQLTRDEQWVVFHDRRLECRTDGRGHVAEHTLRELQTLDVGYGYTSDGGLTYPFRTQGVGAMPSMREVFDAFPGRSFLLDFKSNNPEDGARLGLYLAQLPETRRRSLTVFARDGVLVEFRKSLTEVSAFSVDSTRRCLIHYFVYGWSGLIPSACSNMPVYIPINIAPFLWGWPNRFMTRMEMAGSSIVVVGRFGTEISSGVDTLEDLSRLPSDYNGGIWTNDVSLVRSMIESRTVQ
jgi:glycerophosphoryl diester phosphodiesterase